MDGGDDIYTPGNQNLSNQNQNFNTLGDQSFYALNGLAPTVAGQATSAVNTGINNPFAGQAVTGAQAAGAYGTGTLTPQLQQGATALSNLGGANASYVPQALQTGFDPQNALYNRNLTQTIGQQNAINAQNGVAGTPYAAGVTGDAARNFGLDWLDRSLARQNTAAGTAATLTGAANTGYGGASTVGNSAIQTGAQSAALPYAAQNDIATNILKLLSGENLAVGGATGNNDAAMSQILSYLGYGTGATQQKQQADNAAWSGIGDALGSAAALAFL